MVSHSSTLSIVVVFFLVVMINCFGIQPTIATGHPNITHAANVKCNVFDLLQVCKDSVVDVAESGEDKNLEDLRDLLIEECEEMNGLLVAKCLMKNVV